MLPVLIVKSASLHQWRRAYTQAASVKVLQSGVIKSKRFDEDTRFHDELVQIELLRWWKATRREADLDNDMQLDRQEYSTLYERIVYAFNHDDDERTDLSVLEAKLSLEKDWSDDSRGDGYIDRSDFYDMVYEIAYTWAEDLDSDGLVSTCICAVFDYPNAAAAHRWMRAISQPTWGICTPESSNLSGRR
jgi:hypothetical protein